jgi:hypothetical protein
MSCVPSICQSTYRHPFLLSYLSHVPSTQGVQPELGQMTTSLLYVCHMSHLNVPYMSPIYAGSATGFGADDNFSLICLSYVPTKCPLYVICPIYSGSANGVGADDNFFPLFCHRLHSTGLSVSLSLPPPPPPPPRALAHTYMYISTSFM